MNKLKSKKGSTLVECIVAMAIIVAMTIPLMSTLLISNKIEYNVSDTFGAKNLATGALKAFQFSDNRGQFESKIQAVYRVSGSSSSSGIGSAQVDVLGTDTSYHEYQNHYKIAKYVANGADNTIKVYGDGDKELFTLAYEDKDEFQSQWEEIRNPVYLDTIDESYSLSGYATEYILVIIPVRVRVNFARSLKVGYESGRWSFFSTADSTEVESTIKVTESGRDFEDVYYNGSSWFPNEQKSSSYDIRTALDALSSRDYIQGTQKKYQPSYKYELKSGTAITNDTYMSEAVITTGNGKTLLEIKDTDRDGDHVLFSGEYNDGESLSSISPEVDSTSSFLSEKTFTHYVYNNTVSNGEIRILSDGTFVFDRLNKELRRYEIEEILDSVGEDYYFPDAIRHEKANNGNSDITVNDTSKTKPYYVLSFIDLYGNTKYLKNDGSKWVVTDDMVENEKTDKYNQNLYQTSSITEKKYVYKIELKTNDVEAKHFAQYWVPILGYQEYTATTSLTYYYIKVTSSFDGRSVYYYNGSYHDSAPAVSFDSNNVYNENKNENQSKAAAQDALRKAFSDAGAYLDYNAAINDINNAIGSEAGGGLAGAYYKSTVDITQIDKVVNEQYSITYSYWGSTYYWNGSEFTKTKKENITPEEKDAFMDSATRLYKLDRDVAHSAKISAEEEGCGEWYKFGTTKVFVREFTGDSTTYRNELLGIFGRSNEKLETLTAKTYDIVYCVGNVEKNSSNQVVFYDKLGGVIFTFEEQSEEFSIDEAWQEYVVDNDAVYSRNDDTHYSLKFDNIKPLLLNDGLECSISLVEDLSNESDDQSHDDSVVESAADALVLFKLFCGEAYVDADGVFGTPVRKSSGAIYTSLYTTGDGQEYTVIVIADYRVGNQKCVAFVVAGNYDGVGADGKTADQAEKAFLQSLTVGNYLEVLKDNNIILEYTTGEYTKG